MHMPIKIICDLTKKIKNTYEEKDLNRLAKRLGIVVAYRQLGKKPASCKGFYVVISQIKHITINSDIPEEEQQIILPHEIGHAILDHSTETIRDYQLFPTRNYMEIEANIAAAELILDDSEVLERLRYEYTFSEIAKDLAVYPEFLAYKYYAMESKGFEKLRCPIDIKADFLRFSSQESHVAENDEGADNWWDV